MQPRVAAEVELAQLPGGGRLRRILRPDEELVGANLLEVGRRQKRRVDRLQRRLQRGAVELAEREPRLRRGAAAVAVVRLAQLDDDGHAVAPIARSPTSAA